MRLIFSTFFLSIYSDSDLSYILTIFQKWCCCVLLVFISLFVPALNLWVAYAALSLIMATLPTCTIHCFDNSTRCFADNLTFRILAQFSSLVAAMGKVHGSLTRAVCFVASFIMDPAQSPQLCFAPIVTFKFIKSIFELFYQSQSTLILSFSSTPSSPLFRTQLCITLVNRVCYRQSSPI